MSKRRRNKNETNLSTQKETKKQSPWIPQENGIQIRQKRFETSSQQRSQEPLRISLICKSNIG